MTIEKFELTDEDVRVLRFGANGGCEKHDCVTCPIGDGETCHRSEEGFYKRLWDAARKSSWTPAKGDPVLVWDDSDGLVVLRTFARTRVSTKYSVITEDGITWQHYAALVAHDGTPVAYTWTLDEIKARCEWR